MSFLDAPTFDHADPHAQELLGVLIEAYWEADAVEAVVRAVGVRHQSIAWTKAVEDIWPDVLEQAAKANLLRKVINHALADGKVSAYRVQLTAIVDAARADASSAPACADHFLADLAGRRAVVDRVGLRDHLRRLVDDSGEVIIVDGPPQSGRSYSWYLIEHVAERTGAFTTCLIDLAKWSDAAATPTDVVQLIAEELGWNLRDFNPDPTAQDVTRSARLLAWLKGQAKRTPGPVCLVFDGLASPAVATSTLRFIGDVAAAAANAELGSFRVVLLEWAGPLDARVEPWILRDVVADIPLSEARQYFQRLAESGGKRLKATQVDALLASLLGQPLPDPVPLRAFDVRTSDIAMKLSRGVYA